MKKTDSSRHENNSNKNAGYWLPTRRVFLKSSALALAGFCIPSKFAASANRPVVRFGVVTDSHYADIDAHGNRYYQESLTKMAECVELMNDKKVDFMIHLGDLINGMPAGNVENLRQIESIFAGYAGPRYHVLGNHDMDKISKQQFQSEISNTGIPKEATYYSFGHKGIHFIVLDPNYREDGEEYQAGNYQWTDANIPSHQQEWLEKDLTLTDKAVIVCTHQLLDQDEGDYYVRNARQIRQVLEKSSQVLAVLQGHQHKGQYNLINGIHYLTMKAMVEGSGEENNSYAIAEVYETGSIEITGYRKSMSKHLKKETIK